ncbi:YdaS family helix-turn-helix protein [Sphingomonas bisphenolicum]
MLTTYTKLNNRTRNEYVDHTIQICIDAFMNVEITRYEALVLCRDAAGSDSQMARDLGVPQPKVWRWINQSKQLPGEYVLLAESLYGVSRCALRPDLYPLDLPPATVRWAGVDRRAAGRAVGVDSRSHRVSFNGPSKMKGAAL